MGCAMAAEIRIAIADDHPLLRKGLRQVLEADSNIKVVLEAGDGEVLLSEIEPSRTQIAIVDIDMPKQDGFAVAKEINKRKFPVDVIFLTIHDEESYLPCRHGSGDKGLHPQRQCADRNYRSDPHRCGGPILREPPTGCLPSPSPQPISGFAAKVNPASKV